MKNRTSRELRQFAEILDRCSFNYVKSKKYSDQTEMDESLRMLNFICQLLNSEGYHVEKIGTDHLNSLNLTWWTFEVKESDTQVDVDWTFRGTISPEDVEEFARVLFQMPQKTAEISNMLE